MPSLRNSPSGQFSLGCNGTVLARLLRIITRLQETLGTERILRFRASLSTLPSVSPHGRRTNGVRCTGHRSALRCPMQRAGIILAASRNLRLQVADGRTKPSDGHTKTAYVHPKTANGDFTKHPEDFHHTAGTDSEGWRETCPLLPTLLREALLRASTALPVPSQRPYLSIRKRQDIHQKAARHPSEDNKISVLKQ